MAACLWLFGDAASWAQTEGRISGFVQDTSYAVIPGVTVTVENASSGIYRGTVTNARGHYAIANLPVGAYSIRAEKAGLRTVTRRDIHVGVADRVTVNLTIRAGDVHDEIQVTEAIGND